MNDARLVPSEKTADRAVELWRRMLRNPKYDNMGDTGSPEERQNSAIAGGLASMMPNNVTSELLDQFCIQLKISILDSAISLWQRRSLDVDYGPCATLSDVADAVGLKVEFPWKTTMTISRDYLVVSYGYGAESIFHYPLTDGRWWLTDLRGGEVNKLLDYINDGTPMQWDIEDESFVDGEPMRIG